MRTRLPIGLVLAVAAATIVAGVMAAGAGATSIHPYVWATSPTTLVIVDPVFHPGDMTVNVVVGDPGHSVYHETMTFMHPWLYVGTVEHLVPGEVYGVMMHLPDGTFWQTHVTMPYH